jgi:hypothetical protein
MPTRSALLCLAISTIVAAGRLGAGPVAVFSEKEFYALDALPAPVGPADPAEHAFYVAYGDDQANHPSFEKTMDLVNPPSWGKTISADTHGLIRYHPSFPGGFVCRLTLDGLLPDHVYILTLNGNPSLAGNSLLLSLVPGMSVERYYDFLMVKSDLRGQYDSGFGIFLKPGQYDVRCYVKDASDFKIVLYRDYFPFEVREPAPSPP